jgi:hypothetical protein
VAATDSLNASRAKVAAVNRLSIAASIRMCIESKLLAVKALVIVLESFRIRFRNDQIVVKPIIIVVKVI